MCNVLHACMLRLLVLCLLMPFLLMCLACLMLLLMLVAAFIGYEEMMNIYKIAIEKEYRFLSYGDAMLLKYHEV